MSFDRLAPVYRAMELVLAGGKLQRARLAWLPEVTVCRDALLVGEGAGRFLAACADRLPQTHFTCLDASPEMLRVAKSRWLAAGGDEARVQFVNASLPDWQPAAGGYGLIVTHFFLDCFPPETLAKVIATLTAGAAPGAHWLAADFQEAGTGLARLRSRAILALMYRFFRAVTRLPAKRLTNPDAWLTENGWQLRGRRVSEWGLLHSDWWSKTAAPIVEDAVAPAK